MDFEKRLKRRIGWDKHGVSEVIGTILTMTITIVLFSSIMLMVNRFPAPGDNAFVNFSGNIDPLDDWSQGAYINLTNTGGISMVSGYTLIFMKIDDTTYNLRIRGTYNATTYGLQSSNENWEAGDTWSFRVAPGNISQDSTVNVAIVDVEKDTVVWTHELFGGDQAFSPVIGEGWVDSDLSSPRRDPINFNREFTFFVKIIDPNDDLDPASVYVDMSDINLDPHTVLTDPESDGIFSNVSIMGSSLSAGYYRLIVHASDLAGHKSSTTIIVPVGQDIGNVPNLVILEEKISFSRDNPKHGDIITISATIRNLGKAFTWADVYFYDGDMTADPIGQDVILISGVDSQIASLNWRAAPGGMHEIFVNAVVRAPKEDYDPSDNYNSSSLTVLPTILLVDDDNHENDRSAADTVSYMRSSLVSASFSYDYVMVGNNLNGPGYDYGDYRLQNYDIVIWMLGYEETSTLTDSDQTNIQKFLTDTSNNRNNTGSLWLIGHGWLSDPNINANFTQNVLHVQSDIAIPNATNNVSGIPSHIVSDEWSASGSSGPFSMIERVAGSVDIYNITHIPDTAADTETNNMLMIGDDSVSISFENFTLDERFVLFPWEFSRIEDPAIQTQMAFKVIMWLGNISMTIGKDLAVSGQEISPSYVFYQEYVNVSATIRNNGADDISGVMAGLYIDGIKLSNSSMMSGIIPGMGGSWKIWYSWQANTIGTHILKWKVDPDNVIIETNENNNEISDYLSTGELTVEFRILIVDDDEGLTNETGAVKGIMDDLGYAYETYNVTAPGTDGPDRTIMQDYSAVIWVTGNASESTSLTPNDEESIRDYMNNQSGRLWLIGTNCLGNATTGDFEGSTLGIQGMSTNQPLPRILEGVVDDPITHGMELQIPDGANADIIIPGPGASGILTNSIGYYGIKYDSGSSMSVVMTMSLLDINGSSAGYIDGIDARSELIYMIFHWFEKPDPTAELRTTRMDFYQSNAHPTLGDAYVLRVKVHNVGGSTGNALVRFIDGTTQIGSDSIGIDPDDTTTAEIIWRPLFAGNRTLTVQVDPIIPVSEVTEKFEWFNNNISINTYVYYFWDDMEDLALSYSKWDHYSTVVNINGESPIDYFTTATSMDTDVISDWNETESYNVVEVTDISHTIDTSFYMEEPTGAFGVAGDVLVSIVIDNSDSMTDRTNSTGSSWLDVAKYAAKHLISGMTDASVVSIYAFGGNNVITVIGMTPLAGAGRTTVNNAIDAIAQGQMTLIWDAIGTAYMDVNTSIPTWPDLTPAVVVLSDGADYMSNDGSNFLAIKLEAASSEWAPWHDMQPELGYPVVNYPAGSHKGKYANPYDEYGPGGSISQNGRWWGAGGGSYIPDRKGLLTADLPIYTVGLALEHFDPVWAPVTATEPPDGTVDTNAVWSGGNEAGTVEYNLWRISNTSGAEYFYAPNPDDLKDIFTTIGQIIGSGGFNQTRAPGDPNVDKRAVTETFSLDGIEKAQLTFWHKYDIIQGGNGAFLQVAYKDPNVDGDGDGDPANDWDYKYIIPPGEYTGGLYYNYDVYDDFGTLIKWCWNGISGGGSYQWEYVSFDISSFVPEPYRNEVRVVFNYTQFGGGSGNGWWIDDVKLVVSRDENAILDTADKDLWQLSNTTAYSGNYSWSNVDPDTGFMKPGIDNSLQTMPIDLTNARNAYLSAYLKFNINTDDGMPPDGFRIEVSSNGGTTWTAINQGSRSAWNVSGALDDASDGIPGDNKSYSGIDAGDGWVEIGSLTRVNVDLTNWRGSQILIRFRMVTNSHPLYDNYEDPNALGGFYVDDVQIKGESLSG